jgi:endonuclease YncB( thermonuclease family)
VYFWELTPDVTPRFTIGFWPCPRGWCQKCRTQRSHPQTYGHDKYGRTLGGLFLPDGTNVNHTLVKDGWCWWYRKYAPGNTVLEGLEKEAREARKGLWADPQPVPPWEWRKRNR